MSVNETPEQPSLNTLNQGSVISSSSARLLDDFTGVVASPFLYVSDKVQPGSVKGSIFNLVVVIVGAGMVSLPYCFKQCGIIPACIILILGGCLTYFSAGKCLVAAAAEIALIEPNSSKSYPDLAFRIGKQKLEIFMKVVLALSLYGFLVSYLVVIAQLIQEIYETITLEEVSGFVGNQKDLMACSAAAVFFPCLARDVSSLRFTSLLGMACAVYLAGVLMVEYFYRMSNGDLPEIRTEHLYSTDWTGYVHVVPIFILSYACHSSILSVYNELKFPSQRRMLKVTRRGVVVCCSLYVICGVFGFLTFLDDTLDNILVNDYHHSYAIMIAQIGLLTNLAFSMPIYMNVLRQIWEINDKHIVIHVLITGSILASAWGIASAIPNISFAFEVVGSTTLPITCYVMPCAFVWYLIPEYRSSATKKYAALVFAILIIIISIINVLEKLTIIP